MAEWELLGISSCLAVWPSLDKGGAKCAQGPASPCGAEEDQEEMALPCGHMALPQGTEACLTTWLGLVLPLGVGTTFDTSTAISPFWPVEKLQVPPALSLRPPSGFSSSCA